MRRLGCAKTRNRSRGVIRRHLKFMGVENTTLARYASAVERFWACCDFSVGHVPRSARELDLYFGEYINHLVHDDCLFQWILGATALSWRNPISVTGAELNMCDVLFPLEVLLGFCGFHAFFGRLHVVGALYVGF